jgi:hypothetical protein
LVSIAAGTGLGNLLLGLSHASAEGVGSVAIEAATVDADALVEEVSGLADAGADSLEEILTVGAAGLRDTSSCAGVKVESIDARGAAVDITWALSTVGVAGLAAAGDGGESWAATGDALSERDDTWGALADAVDGSGSSRAGGLAGSLEVVETAEAGSAGTGAVTCSTRVRAVGADTTSRTDGQVLAWGAVVEGGACGTVSWAGDASSLTVIVELVRKASLLADRACFHVSCSTGDAVLRIVGAAVAAGRAGNTESAETELVFSALDGARTVNGNRSMKAGGTVSGWALTGGALDGAGSALGHGNLPEATGAGVNAWGILTDLLERNSGTLSPASSLVEDLIGRARNAVASWAQACGASEVADLADTAFRVGAFHTAEDARLGDWGGLKVSLSVEAASAVWGVVDACLARSIARRADPVSWWFVSDGTSRADWVAASLVHVEAVSTVVADEVLSASLAAAGAALADISDRSKAIVAGNLTDAALKKEGSNARNTHVSGGALITASSTGEALIAGWDEGPGRAGALVVRSADEGVHAGGASVGIRAYSAVGSTGGTIPHSVSWDSEEGAVGAGAGAVVVGSSQCDAWGAVSGWSADSASALAGLASVVGVGVVSVNAHTDAFGKLDDSVLGSETLDAQLEALLALWAEGISVTVRLDARAIRSRVESSGAQASLSTLRVSTLNSIFGGVTGGAESRRSGAGEALGVAQLASSGEVGVVEFVVSSSARADSAGEDPMEGGVASGASRSIGAGQASGRAGSAVDSSTVEEANDAGAIVADVPS